MNPTTERRLSQEPRACGLTPRATRAATGDSDRALAALDFEPGSEVLSEETAAIACAFCHAIASACRKKGGGCCARCKCVPTAVQRVSGPAPFVNLGMGGEPLHPRKCGTGCPVCSAIGFYRGASDSNRRSAIVTSGEGVEVQPAAPALADPSEPKA